MQAKKSELIGLLVSDGSIREYTSKYTEFVEIFLMKNKFCALY